MADFGKLNFAVSFNPQTAFPLDARYYFSSLSAAEAAAATAVEVGSSDGTYFYGENVCVVTESSADLYIIQPDKTLKAVGSAVLGDGKSIEIVDGKQRLDARPETIRRALEGSLKRLKTDYVDLYYLHRVDPKVPVEEVAGVMAEFIREGKIRGWGLSEAGVKTIARAHAVCPLTAVQSEYSMMERMFEKNVIPICGELGIGFVAFSPMASGFLSGKYQKTDVYTGDDVRRVITRFAPENMEANQPLLLMLQEFAEQKHATSAQISLAWMLHKYSFVIPIPGMRKEERLKENFGAAEITLTENEFDKIEKALSNIAIHGNRTDEDIAKLRE